MSTLPIISVGFVKILSRLSKFLFKEISTPITIKTAKKENIIKFKIRHKFPFFNSFSFFTNLLKSPKFKITKEKYAKNDPATVIKGKILAFKKKLL